MAVQPCRPALQFSHAALLCSSAMALCFAVQPCRPAPISIPPLRGFFVASQLRIEILSERHMEIHARFGLCEQAPTPESFMYFRMAELFQKMVD